MCAPRRGLEGPQETLARAFVGLPGSGRGLSGSGRRWERAGASPGPAGV